MQPLEIIGGYWDLLILLLVAVLLFGGTRLAGIGKGAGRAIREFKEETDGMRTKQVSSGSTAVNAGQPVVGQPVITEPVESLDVQAAADKPVQNR